MSGSFFVIGFVPVALSSSRSLVRCRPVAAVKTIAPSLLQHKNNDAMRHFKVDCDSPMHNGVTYQTILMQGKRCLGLLDQGE